MTDAQNTPCSDPIIEAVVSRLRQRSEVGLEKYGTTLADSPESTLAFVRHAQAEAMDLANYLEVLAQRLPEVEQELAALRASNDRMAGALRSSRCPHPITEAEDETVEACIKAGVCGCDNVLALTASPAPASGWRPIETAPDELTRVLVYYPPRAGYQEHIRICDVTGDAVTPVNSGTFHWRKECGELMWMPLPAAPAQGGGE